MQVCVYNEIFTARDMPTTVQYIGHRAGTSSNIYFVTHLTGSSGGLLTLLTTLLGVRGNGKGVCVEFFLFFKPFANFLKCAVVVGKQ